MKSSAALVEQEDAFVVTKAGHKALLEEVEPAGEELQQIRAGDLAPWPGLNPRRVFKPEKHEQLVNSIRARGVRQPLLVHQHANMPAWIVAGERRWRAAMEIGPDTLVPCMVKVYTEDEALEISGIENLDRDDLTAVEEARWFVSMLAIKGMTQKKLADRVSRTQPHISNRIRLLELPDNVLDLVEEGIVEITHARDLLLPFAKIPEKKRTKLFADIATGLRKAADKAPMAEHDLRNLVVGSAKKISKLLERYGYQDEAALFDADLHKECTCNGPRFKYDWGQATVRCFDDAWWNAQQDTARQEQDEERKRAIAKASKKTKKIDGRAVISEDAFELQYGYGKYQEVLRGRTPAVQRGDELLDPSKLPDESLVIVKRNGRLDLVCVDMEAVKKAKAGIAKERKALIEQRRAERRDRDLAEAASLSLEPWMCGAVMRSRPDTGRLLEISREIGIDLKKHGQVYEALEKLSNDEAVTLFKIIAIRQRRGEGGYTFEDPIEVKVNAELQEKYAPEYQALAGAAPLRAGLTQRESDEVERLLTKISIVSDPEFEGSYKEVPGGPELKAYLAARRRIKEAFATEINLVTQS